jgi:short-subunit dehydrogenase
MNQKQKTILITGATSGIGRSLFERYVEKGHIVIACGRNKEQLKKLDIDAKKTLCFDINSSDEIANVSKEIGSIDILILNAGTCLYIDDVVNFENDLFEQVINTNLIALGKLLHHFLPKVSQGGQVVFVSSSATILPFPRAEAYGASKAGVDYLANSLRLDLKPKNIDVTLVHPGFIKTPLTDKNDFPMPFLLTSEQASERIYSGVEKRKSYLHFPKRLTLFLKILALLPSPIWHWLMLRDVKS